MHAAHGVASAPAAGSQHEVWAGRGRGGAARSGGGGAGGGEMEVEMEVGVSSKVCAFGE